MAVVALLVFGAVAVWTFRATPRFRSQALLKFESRSGSGSGLFDQMQNFPGLSLAGLGRDEIETDMGVLRSRRILDAAIDSLALSVRVVAPAGERSRIMSVRRARGLEVSGHLTFARTDAGRYSLEAKNLKDPTPTPLPATIGPGDSLIVGEWMLTLSDSVRTAGPATIELDLLPKFRVRAMLDARLAIHRADAGSKLVEVNFEDEDRFLAAAVVDRVVKEFVTYSQLTEQAEAGGQVAELRQERDAQKIKLADAEERLRAYQVSSQLLAPEEQATQQVKRIAVLNGQLDVLTVERAALSRLLTIIERRAQGGRDATAYRQLATFPTLISNRAIQDLLQSLLALENKRAELGVRRSDTNDELRQYTTRITELEQQLYRVGGQYLESLDQQIATAGQQVTTLTDTLQSLPNKEMQFVRLVRDRTIYNESYILLLKQLRTAELQDAMRLQRIRVVDSPVVANEDNPVYPRPAVQLFLGALLAVLVALATGLALEIWSDRRTTLREPSSP